MASAEISESVIHAITPADCCDQYYAGEKNTDLQCFPTLVDNRFYVSLNSLNQGSTNTVIFNPDQGLSDIVLTLVLPASTGESGAGSYFGYAMPDNWGASMINTLALRVGGSALYYFTQDQLFIDTMTDCEDEGKKNAVSSLSGGAILSQASYESLSNRIANVYVKMPFNSISALQKTLCLPTDLLTQPIQILITFNRFADVAYWYGAGDPVLSNLPNSFDSASVNFRKTTMQNSEHLLARRENMLENALNYPLRYFAQTTFRTNFIQSQDGGNNQNYNTINLTGFRSGSLKYIDIWAKPLEAGTGVVPAGFNYNWAKFLSVRLLINGLVMYDAQLNAPMWGLCEKKTPTAFNTTTLSTAVGNGSAVAFNYSSPWVSIPFAQLCEDVAFRNVVNLGYSIQNSVVNLAVIMEAAGNYELSASYHYTCNMLFTKNSAEYVF